jgi:tRNA pseudouridine55 synthase
VGDAKKLSELTRENVELLPLTEAAKAIFPELPLSTQDEIDIRHGKRLACPSSVTGSFAAIDANNNLVAVLEKSGKQLKSAVVFAPQATAE